MKNREVNIYFKVTGTSYRQVNECTFNNVVCEIMTRFLLTEFTRGVVRNGRVVAQPVLLQRTSNFDRMRYIKPKIVLENGSGSRKRRSVPFHILDPLIG